MSTGDGEFDIIQDIFAAAPVERDDVCLGVGDDCAILAPPFSRQLVVSVDTLVEDIHFPAGMRPERLGYRALAVSLSDLAAMGAEPAWVTLALTVPGVDVPWIKRFHEGFQELAISYDMELVGGDLTRGPLTVSVSVYGFVPSGAALLRSGARPGDCVLVTGTVGDSAGGLACGAATVTSADGPDAAYLCTRFERPEPRVDFGLALRGVASAAIDVSDGLAQDLGHVLRRSGVGAQIDACKVPRSDELRRVFGEDRSLEMALAGGDDYELCFTCSTDVLGAVERISRECDVRATPVGTVTEESELRVTQNGVPMSMVRTGYDHFRAP